MSWFARLRRRLKNYTSDGDYAGSHGGGGSNGERGTSNAKAKFETTMNRPDRFDGGGGFSG